MYIYSLQLVIFILLEYLNDLNNNKKIGNEI